MSELTTSLVDGREIRAAPLAFCRELARETGSDLAGAFASLLAEGVWPEPLARNAPALSAPEARRLIFSAAVVLGLGGLGGCTALMLARAGVGRLVLCDGDVFAESNLNRQAACTTNNLGAGKVRETARILRDVAPWVRVRVHEEPIGPENAARVLFGCHAALDGLDAVAPRKCALAAARRLRVPFVHAAAAGFSGHVSTFLPGRPETLDRLYPSGAAEPGPVSVLAPTVNVIAGLAAQEAVRLLCGRPPLYAGRLAHFDGEAGVLSLVNL